MSEKYLYYEPKPVVLRVRDFFSINKSNLSSGLHSFFCREAVLLRNHLPFDFESYRVQVEGSGRLMDSSFPFRAFKIRFRISLLPISLSLAVFFLERNYFFSLQGSAQKRFMGKSFSKNVQHSYKTPVIESYFSNPRLQAVFGAVLRISKSFSRLLYQYL